MKPGDKVAYYGDHEIMDGKRKVRWGDVAEVVRLIGAWVSVKWGPRKPHDSALIYASKFRPVSCPQRE